MSETPTCISPELVRAELDGLRADRLINDAILASRLTRFEKENAELRCTIVELTKDRDSWKREFEMYANAWLRELGGRIFSKSHRIDALVKTTRWMRERSERLSAIELASKFADMIAEYGPTQTPPP